MKTKVVFSHLPYYCEYSLGEFPLIREPGFIFEIENLKIIDKNNPEKIREVKSKEFRVKTTKYVYSTNQGLTQFLIVEPVD